MSPASLFPIPQDPGTMPISSGLPGVQGESAGLEFINLIAGFAFGSSMEDQQPAAETQTAEPLAEPEPKSEKSSELPLKLTRDMSVLFPYVAPQLPPPTIVVRAPAEKQASAPQTKEQASGRTEEQPLTEEPQLPCVDSSILARAILSRSLRPAPGSTQAAGNIRGFQSSFLRREYPTSTQSLSAPKSDVAPVDAPLPEESAQPKMESLLAELEPVEEGTETLDVDVSKLRKQDSQPMQASELVSPLPVEVNRPHDWEEAPPPPHKTQRAEEFFEVRSFKQTPDVFSKLTVESSPSETNVRRAPERQRPVAFQAEIQTLEPAEVSSEPAASPAKPATQPSVPTKAPAATPAVEVSSSQVKQTGNTPAAASEHTASSGEHKAASQPARPTPQPENDPIMNRTKTEPSTIRTEPEVAPRHTDRPAPTEKKTDTQGPSKSESSLPPQPAKAVVKDVVVRIPSGSQHVDVHIVERAGKVHVTVRSADPALTSSLRSELSQLVQKLESHGLKTETWTPSDTWPLSGPKPPEALGAQQGMQWSDSSEGQSRQQQDTSQQDKRRPGQLPDWLAELEKGLSEENE